MTGLLLALIAAVAHARSDVVILKSDSLDAYQAPIERFRSALGRPTTVYDLMGKRERADALARQLAADPPPLVFALGAKAAYVAAHKLPNVPLVHAMVINPARYGVGGTQVTGVSTDVAADTALSQFKLFAPKVERLGVLLAASNTGPGTQGALDSARLLGYELNVQRVTNPRDLRAAWDRIASEVDALWLIPDPVVLNPEGYRYLHGETRRRKLPILATTEALVHAGAFMCVAPNRENVGQQAADLAIRILDGGELPGIIPLAEPSEVRVVLNRATLETLGLEVDMALLDFVDEIVEDPRGR
ncbi:MAG: hypothetical protein RLZZ299_1776 [Pseudomonadota bacterium]|jgi:putative ABC transport system substrate-binding protein